MSKKIIRGKNNKHECKQAIEQQPFYLQSFKAFEKLYFGDKSGLWSEVKKPNKPVKICLDMR